MPAELMHPFSKPGVIFSRGLSIWLSLLIFAGCAEEDENTGDSGMDSLFESDDTGGSDSTSEGESETDVADTNQIPIDTDGTCTGDAGPCEEIEDILCPFQVGCVASALCTGLPRPCHEIINPTLCSRQRNCGWDGICLGGAKPCYTLLSALQCSYQRGCIWNVSAEQCGGTARPCSTLGPESCAGQRGCTPNGTCKGAVVTCDNFSTNNCSGQLGCQAKGQCDGEPIPCEYMFDYWNCSGQRGCNWI